MVFFSTTVINRHLLSRIIEYFDPNAFQVPISNYIFPIAWSIAFVPILIVTWFLFLKNKLDRIGINILFIELWFFLASYFYQQITSYILRKNPNLYFNIISPKIGNSEIAFLLFFIIFSLLISGFIWFDKLKPRPKITRSKD